MTFMYNKYCIKYSPEALKKKMEMIKMSLYAVQYTTPHSPQLFQRTANLWTMDGLGVTVEHSPILMHGFILFEEHWQGGRLSK